MKTLAALVAGWVFGVGLVLGGMTRPAVVLGFLDVFGHWNPQLLFLMVSAVVTTAIGYRLVLRRRQPLWAEGFQVPTARRVDRRLLVGGAIFGVGWGLGGYCPGPAFASLAGGAPSLWLFVACMLAGWWAAARFAHADHGSTSPAGTRHANASVD